MSKRVADKYLTDQNWDKEDEVDDDDNSGTFKTADNDVLQTRVIRKAKRRIVGSSQQSTASAFSGFGGLKAPTNSTKPSFGGFNLPTSGNGSNVSQMKPFSMFQSTGSSGSAATQPTIQSSSGDKSSTRTLESKTADSTTSKTIEIKSSDDDTTQNSREYNRQLSALNRSVSEWIKNHVEKNPLCDLTPIFLDYKKYLSEIDDKYGHSDNEGSSQNSFQVSDSQETVSLKSSQNSSLTSSVSDKPKFSLTGFGSKTEEPKPIEINSKTDAPVSKPLFSGFQTSTTTSSPFKGFNVSKTTAFPGFSFSSSMVGSGGSTKQASGQGKDEEEYVPPKPESNVVADPEAFYSIRCKLYYKKEGAYADKGVGQLYLKPSGDKTQLVIRADTAISQILLNIHLIPAIPVKKQGKNNVLIMCIPNPPINEKEKDKVVAFLIRVKTSEDADKLIEIMEEKKREATDKADADR
ncbi:nuclear pore complex protein Nup50-like [Styela clava]